VNHQGSPKIHIIIGGTGRGGGRKGAKDRGVVVRRGERDLVKTVEGGGRDTSVR